MKQITITVQSDIDAGETFELVKLLGVGSASLNGKVITGTAPSNLIGPLRSTRGIESVSETNDTVSQSAPLPEPPPLPEVEVKKSFFPRRSA